MSEPVSVLPPHPPAQPLANSLTSLAYELTEFARITRENTLKTMMLSAIFDQTPEDPAATARAHWAEAYDIAAAVEGVVSYPPVQPTIVDLQALEIALGRLAAWADGAAASLSQHPSITLPVHSATTSPDRAAVIEFSDLLHKFLDGAARHAHSFAATHSRTYAPGHLGRYSELRDRVRDRASEVEHRITPALCDTVTAGSGAGGVWGLDLIAAAQELREVLSVCFEPATDTEVFGRKTGPRLFWGAEQESTFQATSLKLAREHAQLIRLQTFWRNSDESSLAAATRLDAPASTFEKSADETVRVAMEWAASLSGDGTGRIVLAIATDKGKSADQKI